MVEICNHYFESDPEHEDFELVIDHLEKRVICAYCGLKAKEIWTLEGTHDDNGNEV